MDPFHQQDGLIVDGVVTEQCDNAGVIEGSGCFHFALEAQAVARLGETSQVEALEGDGAACAWLDDFVDGALAASAGDFENGVVAEFALGGGGFVCVADCAAEHVHPAVVVEAKG